MASTLYLRGDVVSYQGALYAALNTFTSGASFNVANWDLVLAAPVIPNPTVATLGAAKSTSGAGLPDVLTRLPGDLHYNTTDKKEYVVTGDYAHTIPSTVSRTISSNSIVNGNPYSYTLTLTLVSAGTYNYQFSNVTGSPGGRVAVFTSGGNYTGASQYGAGDASSGQLSITPGQTYFFAPFGRTDLPVPDNNGVIYDIPPGTIIAETRAWTSTDEYVAAHSHVDLDTRFKDDFKGAWIGTAAVKTGEIYLYQGVLYLATAASGPAATTDDFNRANGNYSGVFTTNGSTPVISGNALTSPDSFSRAVSLQTNNVKHVVEADLILAATQTANNGQANDGAWIALGATNVTGDGYWTILFIGRQTDGTLNISNAFHDGGSFTSTGGSTTIKYTAPGYASSAVTVRAEYDGSTGTIILSVNGTQVATFIGSGYQASGTVGMVGVRGTAKADRVAIGSLAPVAFDSSKFTPVASGSTHTHASTRYALNSVGAGLPAFTGRAVGDEHYDPSTGKEYVLTGVAGATVQDTFTRTADGNLAGSTATTGQTWSGGGWYVSGGVATKTAAANATIPVGTGDMEVSCSFDIPDTWTSGYGFALAYGATDDTNGSGNSVAVTYNASGLGFQFIRGGNSGPTLTYSVANDSTFAVRKHTLTIRTQGGTGVGGLVLVFIDGIYVGTFTNDVAVSGTRAGLHGWITTSGTVVDDFQAMAVGTLAWTPTSNGTDTAALHYKNAYSNTTAYAAQDAVTDAYALWAALAAVPAGKGAPSTVPTYLVAGSNIAGNAPAVNDYTNAQSIAQAFTTGASPITNIAAVTAYFYNNTSAGSFRLGIASDIGANDTLVTWVGSAPPFINNPAQVAMTSVISTLPAPITLAANTTYYLVAQYANGVGAQGIAESNVGNTGSPYGGITMGTDRYTNAGNSWSGPLGRSYKFDLQQAPYNQPYWEKLANMREAVVVTKSANYTMVDPDTIVLASGNITITLPTVKVANIGKRYTVKNTGTGTITVAPQSGTIDGAASQVMTVQYSSFDFANDGTNWYTV